jgi:hypothetical protein
MKRKGRCNKYDFQKYILIGWPRYPTYVNFTGCSYDFNNLVFLTTGAQILKYSVPLKVRMRSQWKSFHARASQTPLKGLPPAPVIRPP